MNKYRDKSDFEINELVSFSLGYVHTKSFDPCNNPADAMPIVIESRIAICPIFSSDWCATSDCDAYRVINKNPLRAAMEVFLMMKEAENES